MDLEFRNVKESDFGWLYDLRSQTMTKYIIDTGDKFTRESQTTRIKMDFESINIVKTENKDIGMFKVKRSSDKWEIIQIQLLPEYQGLGIGSKLIQNLQAEATSQGIPVFLSVLKVNPARRLYERLGFEVVQEKEKSYTMCFRA